MSGLPSSGSPIANYYIDGFNLYYGCFKGRGGIWAKYRWLNLHEFCFSAFPRFQFGRIRYFTALLDPPPDDPTQRDRQQEYIRALQTIPGLTVHYGRFATHARRRFLADPSGGSASPVNRVTFANVIIPEEKGSDVNLASYLLVDGFRREYDIAIVVSNDSDLAEPIRLVQSELGLRVGLLNPRSQYAADLFGIANFYRKVREKHLRDAQFPETLEDQSGPITKPGRW